ncbi:hypothetical protein A8B98_00290 [Hymenobacter sp. UV11]|nr:hypothetical protein A8B98_00290 [Hymenobacter sp. UV11]
MTGTRPRVAASADDLIYGVEPGVLPTPTLAPPAAPAAAEPQALPVSRVVFTNQLKPDVYRELRQYEYWAHMELHEVLHEALVAYLADKPEAKKALPPKVAAKTLKRLIRKPS